MHHLLVTNFHICRIWKDNHPIVFLRCIACIQNTVVSALHCAASRGHSECIDVLRKQGANINMVDRNKCTALFYAITLGNKQCTKLLLNAKADPNHVDDRGRK